MAFNLMLGTIRSSHIIQLRDLAHVKTSRLYNAGFMVAISNIIL